MGREFQSDRHTDEGEEQKENKTKQKQNEKEKGVQLTLFSHK